MGVARIVAAAVLLGAVGCGSPAPGPAPTTTAVTPPASPSPTVATSPPTPSPSIDSFAPPGWVDLADVDPSVLVEIRYHGVHNFVGRPIDGYLEPRCLLPRPVAQALRRVQGSARARGYTLKVYDCYRPLRAGEDFRQWRDSGDDRMRAEFYPRMSRAQVFSQGYVAAGGSAHSSGTAVDLTLVRLPVAPQGPFLPGAPLVDCTAPAGQRFADNSIDMGTGYDCFDSRSHTFDERLTAQQRANRLLLRSLMADAGFAGIASEWWHFNYTDPPYRGRYFDFPVAAAALTG